MEHTGQDLPGTDATGAFPAFGRPGADGVQYADSGFLPDDAMPANAGRPAHSSRPADDDRLTCGVRATAGSGLARTTGLAEISHLAEASHLADGADRPDAGWSMNGYRLPDPSQLTEMSSLPCNGWLTDTSDPTDTGDPTGTGDFKDTSDPTGGVEFFPRGGVYPDRGGWYPDGDDTSPAVDWYAGYERYAGEQAGQDTEAAGERFLTRVYARPADPRQGPPDDDPGRASLADYPAMASLIRQLARLRLDRWLIAGGSLAAAVAVIIAFATAGGSAATRGSGTAQTGSTHAVQPACVSPATGH